MSQDISPAAAAILEGLNDVLRDVQGLPVSGIRKTVVHPVRPKEIRESLKMSQQEFSKAYGIPLATLRNWEQGRRKLDCYSYILSEGYHEVSERGYVCTTYMSEYPSCCWDFFVGKPFQRNIIANLFNFHAGKVIMSREYKE